MRLFKRFVFVAVIITVTYADKQRDNILTALALTLLDGKQVR